MTDYCSKADLDAFKDLFLAKLDAMDAHSSRNAAEIRAEMKAENSALKAEIRAESSALRSEFRGEIAALRLETRTDIERLTRDMSWQTRYFWILIALSIAAFFKPLFGG